MEAVRELRRRVKEDGFKGLRIVPWINSLVNSIDASVLKTEGR
jgi:hypothetical protein